MRVVPVGKPVFFFLLFWGHKRCIVCVVFISCTYVYTYVYMYLIVHTMFACVCLSTVRSLLLEGQPPLGSALANKYFQFQTSLYYTIVGFAVIAQLLTSGQNYPKLPRRARLPLSCATRLKRNRRGETAARTGL